ncbi:MAG: EAL domain-containing protein [Tatlockia sp.]
MDENKYDFRILIIDDNIEVHKDFVKILTKKMQSELDVIEHKLLNTDDSIPPNILPQFKIDTAVQGEEGVALIHQAVSEKKPYALAFVDIRMPPGWDGIETIQKIWALDSDIHIVICTAFSDYSWEETIEALGHSDKFLILTKPFDHIAVRQLAYALTRKWKLIRDSRLYTKSLEQAVEKRTEELKFQATHDTLTGLANRALLQDRIQQAIVSYRRHQVAFAILFFDLDRFKLINDSLGHTAGDELLTVTSERLMSAIRAGDTLSRLGGDEFVMVITELKKLDYLKMIANKLLQKVKGPVKIGDFKLVLTCSMGVAVYPEDGTEVATLLSNADAAMYHAKRLGGDQYQFYSKSMNERVIEELELESQLHQAIPNNELAILYQPQFHIQTFKLVAVEALLRWNHPTRGMLLPLDFIPLAERMGLMVPISDWVLKETCLQNIRWQKKGFPPIRMAINVSAQQLSQPNLVEKIENTLKETGLDPQYLELEIHESAIVNASIVDKINKLRTIGVKIALDDFGTGYSNLRQLRGLSLNRLKIDRSFIQNIQCNRNDEVIIQAIIEMAKSMDLEVLAEGVETQKQLDFLKGHHCEEIQGFYFSKPLVASELALLLKDPVAIQKLLKEVKKE